MYAPHPNTRNAAESFFSWYEKGIRGCAELQTSFYQDSAKLDQLLSCVSKLGVPVVFHMMEVIAATC